MWLEMNSNIIEIKEMVPRRCITFYKMSHTKVGLVFTINIDTCKMYLSTNDEKDKSNNNFNNYYC